MDCAITSEIGEGSANDRLKPRQGCVREERDRESEALQIE
jgi:hypothetical protein